MKELIDDMERFIAQKGLGTLLSTEDGKEYISNYLVLKDKQKKGDQ